MTARPEYGDAWVYESIVGAVPGIEVSDRTAVAVQFLAFELAVLAMGWYYGLVRGALAGTAAVAVASAGSALMLRLGNRIRALSAPDPYRRLLFGSSVEVVLGVVAYVLLVTYLFVYDPRTGQETLLTAMLGERPPLPAVALTLLVLWDVTYRIGTGWWACVAACWRSYVYDFAPATAAGYVRADLTTATFGLVQLALVPFVADRPLLLWAVIGHVVAVLTVSLASVVLLRAGEGGVNRP